MAEAITIARPYAEAVFRLARDGKAFPAWSQSLELMAAVAADPAMRQVMDDPNLPAPKIAELFVGVVGERVPGDARNLVYVLVENRRLELLPEIRSLFEDLRAQAENEQDARVVSAFPLSDAQVSELVAQLEKKFGTKIKATVTVDPELIGGVRLEVGDQAYDASVRGQLDAMAATLQK